MRECGIEKMRICWPLPHPQCDVGQYRTRSVSRPSAVSLRSAVRGAGQYRTRSVLAAWRGNRQRKRIGSVGHTCLDGRLPGCSDDRSEKSRPKLCCLRLPGELSSDQRTSWPADYLSPTEPILFFCRLSADPLASRSACQRHAARRCGYGTGQRHEQPSEARQPKAARRCRYGTVTRPHRPAS